MDIGHAFSMNPLEPAYEPPRPLALEPCESAADWHAFDGGLVMIGAQNGFRYDNEEPPHRTCVAPFEIAGRLVTAGEWIAFIEDGGYRKETLWLSDGWAAAQAGGWSAPLYWRREDGAWWRFGLRGVLLVDHDAPVVHVSYYEADAFARWAGARLPTEFEWELAAQGAPDDGHFLEGQHFRPRPPAERGLRQMMGEVWQWTASAYTAYPGFRTADGALGESIGKFMVNQPVLRGASFGTPKRHARRTYRNFFHPHQRWQFAGLRLARDV